MPLVCRSIIVDAPLETTFEISNRIDSWPDMMPEYKKAEVFKREGRMIWFRLANEAGAEWVSWRMLYPPYFTCAERYEPKLPFKFMHLIWTYKALSDRQTEMTWDMSFELPDERREQEKDLAQQLAKHTEVNQAKMKAYIEAQANSK